jgi:transaldolase/glucose-6-phosphate isomerase
LFVYLRQNGSLDKFTDQLIKAGNPVIGLDITGEYDLPGQFYLWEYATAVACSIIGVNAFDQPDVQDSKDRTHAKVDAFQKLGHLDEGRPGWKGTDGMAFGKVNQAMMEAKTTGELIALFLEQVKQGDYVAINAYVPRNSNTFSRLQKLRKSIQKITGTATTLGFGPRFQHSTGQLHKGGPDSSVIIQITMDPARDIEIPEENIHFGVMERAQALGDLEAIMARGKRALRIHMNQGQFPEL